MVNDKKFYDKDDFASKGVAGTALGIGIGALGLELLRNGGIQNVLGGITGGKDVPFEESAFGLYKNQRDTKDELVAKIDKLERQVDVMSAIRPYQDALINAKIDNVALVGDFNLARRTCRMIQGELVLPSTPTVTGYPSYACSCMQSTSTQAGA